MEKTKEYTIKIPIKELELVGEHSADVQFCDFEFSDEGLEISEKELNETLEKGKPVIRTETVKSIDGQYMATRVTTLTIMSMQQLERILD